MAHILVAEDSTTQAVQIKNLLAIAGHEVDLAANGAEAMSAMKRKLPELVLTDLDMPQMNGLQLVEAVRREFPRVPVVLMTAFGSDEVASRALEAGAASYVPKRNLDTALLETIRDVLSVVAADRDQARLSEFLAEYEAHFELDGGSRPLLPIVAHLQAVMAEMNLVDENERIRVGVALETALQSLAQRGQGAHGDSEGRQSGPLYLDARLSRSEAVFVLRREEGSLGINGSTKENPAASLDNDANQWWMLARNFMDEVRLDPAGRELTLIKRGAI